MNPHRLMTASKTQRPRLGLIALAFSAAWMTAGQAHAVQLKVACVQMRLSNDMGTNVNNTVARIASEAAQGTRVVVFSECSLTGYDGNTVPTIQQPAIDNALAQVAAACAAQHVYAIVGTTYYENSVRYNAAVVFGPDGSVVERYYKVHVVESYCTNGNRLAFFRIDGVPATIFICHDERYPELARIPVFGGARIAFYISFESDASSGKNFNYRCQIVGRAVENQSWVISCNAPVGNLGGGDSHGQSRIIGPDGTVYQEAGDQETVIRYTIETDQASNAWAQAGAATPLLSEFWEEGLRVLQMQNLSDFGSVTANPALQPDVGLRGNSPNASLKIACVQMQMGGDVAANATKAVSFIQSEAAQGSRVVVFPECALTDRNPVSLPGVVQAQIDAAISQIATACHARNVYAIMGSPFRDNGTLYNGAYVIDPSGEVIKRYAQVHTDLPGVFTQGSRMSLFKIDGVYASVMVGHDIHFPELSRVAVLGGAKVCFYLAYEPPSASVYASESQVVCRSVESQTFSVFCNAGTGNAAGDSTGHSRIVDPWANVLAQAETAAGDTVIRTTIQTSSASNDYARAGADTPSLAAFWQEGLDVLRINNPSFYGDAEGPPVIAEVTPDPGPALADVEYTPQLTLAAGSPPATTWSILQGPAGAQVDGGGRISGWTPAVGQIGTFYSFEVKAGNAIGESTETWQVLVKSRADLDDDGDVDQSDFGLFQACITGTGAAYPVGCEEADMNGDGAVGEQDLAIFVGCIAGPDSQPRG
jgi:predicted amidohydrolase